MRRLISVQNPYDCESSELTACPCPAATGYEFMIIINNNKINNIFLMNKTLISYHVQRLPKQGIYYTLVGRKKVAYFSTPIL